MVIQIGGLVGDVRGLHGGRAAPVVLASGACSHRRLILVNQAKSPDAIKRRAGQTRREDAASQPIRQSWRDDRGPGGRGVAPPTISLPANLCDLLALTKREPGSEWEPNRMTREPNRMPRRGDWAPQRRRCT
jgi:hypothetical protein